MADADPEFELTLKPAGSSAGFARATLGEVRKGAVEVPSED
jgi:hypothetical protein